MIAIYTMSALWSRGPAPYATGRRVRVYWSGVPWSRSVPVGTAGPSSLVGLSLPLSGALLPRMVRAPQVMTWVVTVS